jgi:uridine kinase
VKVPTDAIVIVEGVFLQRTEWRRFYDFRIFLECARELGTQRVLERDVYLGVYKERFEKYKRSIE